MKFFWLLSTDERLTLANFQPSYVIFPTEGCWQVTAHVNGSELTFVTKVVKTF